MINQLYKLFKRRPRLVTVSMQWLSKTVFKAEIVPTVSRVQRLRAQAENASNMLRPNRLNGSQAPDGLSQMLTAMEELDAPENMPEELNLVIWERFCFVRKTKVESEQRVKQRG